MSSILKLIEKSDRLVTHARSIIPDTKEAKSEIHEVAQNLINMNDHLTNRLAEAVYDLENAYKKLDIIYEKQTKILQRLVDLDKESIRTELENLWPSEV